MTVDSRAPQGKRDRSKGLLIVGSAFVAGLCISWWARTVSAPGGSEPPPPTTDGLAGFPKAVDVVVSLDGAQRLTPRDELRGIAAWGVASDGTVDVALPGARIRYVFGSRRGDGPQPPRPPGTLPKRVYCGKQTVHVKDHGFVADPDQPTYPCASQRGEALPSPRCGPKEVWAEALRRHVPGNLRANVEYFRSAVGPAWRFDVPGTAHHFVLYGDCERELTGGDTVGSVP